MKKRVIDQVNNPNILDLSVANINSRVDISIKPEVEEIQLMALSDDVHKKRNTNIDLIRPLY